MKSTHRCQILLAESLRVASLLDELADGQRNLVVLQLLGFAIQLGGILRGDMLFVGRSSD